MIDTTNLEDRPTTEVRRPMIVARDAHVTYKVYASGRKMSPRETLLSTRAMRGGRELQSVHALRGVSFTASEGESIGVIGHNGSGKSTLFRAMSGLMPTSEGQIWARDRPVLLGVNAALVPELSGENNIKLGLLAMGFSLEEAAASVDEIADFAELNEFLYHPMRTYSSGMAARLRFAIASARPHSILLIDEALSVGDRRFKMKSEERIRELSASAGLVMIVSHSTNALKDTCARVLWIHKGELVADGAADDVIDEYIEWTKQPGGSVGAASTPNSALPQTAKSAEPGSVTETARTISRRKRFRLAGEAGRRKRMIAMGIAVVALLLAAIAGAAIAVLTSAPAPERTTGGTSNASTVAGPEISGFTSSAASASCEKPSGRAQVPLNWTVEDATRVALGIGGSETNAFNDPVVDNLPDKGTAYVVGFPCTETSRAYTLMAENAAGGRSSSVVIVSRTLLSDKPTPTPAPTPTTTRRAVAPKPQPVPSVAPVAPVESPAPAPVESPTVAPVEPSPQPPPPSTETPAPETPAPAEPDPSPTSTP